MQSQFRKNTPTKEVDSTNGRKYTRFYCSGRQGSQKEGLLIFELRCERGPGWTLADN
jgi:hypothetical protein